MEPRVAVNICDLDAVNNRVGVSVVALLLSDFASKHSPRVETDPSRFDGDAVILDGPAARDPERLEAVVKLLQTVIGPRRIGRRVRCYREGPRGGWPEIRPGRKE